MKFMTLPISIPNDPFILLNSRSHLETHSHFSKTSNGIVCICLNFPISRGLWQVMATLLKQNTVSLGLDVFYRTTRVQTGNQMDK